MFGTGSGSDPYHRDSFEDGTSHGADSSRDNGWSDDEDRTGDGSRSSGSRGRSATVDRGAAPLDHADDSADEDSEGEPPATTDAAAPEENSPYVSHHRAGFGRTPADRSDSGKSSGSSFGNSGSRRRGRYGRGRSDRSGSSEDSAYAAYGDDESRPRRSGRGRAGNSGSGDAAAGSGLPGGGTEAQAKEVCLRLLADRARSRSELEDRLAAKGYSPEVAARALDRLAEVGLIDDSAFAHQWVQSRHTFSGKGKRALAQELHRKGVAKEDADEALSTITSEDEQDRAADLVRRKLRTLPADLDREKIIRRLVGMLARRGYNSSTAYAVVKSELADLDSGDMDFGDV
nr:recombination regulator RecX [Nocardia jejuensis]